MPINRLFLIVLALISTRVAYGLYRKQNMWHWIVVYWVVLTIKNAVDFLM